MNSNLKKVAYLCGAVAYTVIASSITNNFIDPLLKSLPAWVSLISFFITMLPVMWLVGKAIDMKGNELNNKGLRPIEKNWWYKRKVKHAKK